MTNTTTITSTATNTTTTTLYALKMRGVGGYWINEY